MFTLRITPLLSLNYAAIGTHDINTAEMFPSTISITYFAGSNARGALLSQVCIANANNLSLSAFQTLDRSSQLHVPYNLMALRCSGPVQIFLYDIEESGVLFRGENYPAVKQRLATDRQGISIIMYKLM